MLEVLVSIAVGFVIGKCYGAWQRDRAYDRLRPYLRMATGADEWQPEPPEVRVAWLGEGDEYADIIWEPTE